MRVTVEIPSQLVRGANTEAALRGCKLHNLVEEGLRLLLESPTSGEQKEPPALYDAIKKACGDVDSHIADLASDPKHMEGLGRHSMGDR